MIVAGLALGLAADGRPCRGAADRGAGFFPLAAMLGYTFISLILKRVRQTSRCKASPTA